MLGWTRSPQSHTAKNGRVTIHLANPVLSLNVSARAIYTSPLAAQF